MLFTYTLGVSIMRLFARRETQPLAAPSPMSSQTHKKGRFHESAGRRGDLVHRLPWSRLSLMPDATWQAVAWDPFPLSRPSGSWWPNQDPAQLAVIKRAPSSRRTAWSRR